MQERLYGVDFSGGKDAGNKIWIAQAVPRWPGDNGASVFPLD